MYWRIMELCWVIYQFIWNEERQLHRQVTFIVSVTRNVLT